MTPHEDRPVGPRHALLAIVLAGGVLRLLSAISVPFIFDEYMLATIADRVSLRPLNLPLHGDMHGAGGVYAVALGEFLAGPNVLGYRLMSVASGTALIWIVGRLGMRQFGSHVGLAAAALIATNEYLIGISHFATNEMLYLALSSATVLAFLCALDQGGTVRYARVGLAVGLGLMTKEVLVLWLPLLAWELAARRGWRALFERGPLVAALIVLLAVTPDLVWNLLLKATSNDITGQGFVEQISRLGLSWSVRPTALFLRAFHESAVSEYPSMTSLPGGLLLAGAVGSLLLLRKPAIRMWLLLGWVPFLFFSFFGGQGEFWWADLAVVPFVLLTVASVARLSPWLLLVVVCLSLPGAFNVTRASENCYPSAALSSGPLMVRCHAEQRVLIGDFPARDHAALSRVGSMRLPVANYYEQRATAYLAWLSNESTDPDAWPVANVEGDRKGFLRVVPPEARAAEIARVQQILQALRAP